MPPTSNLNYVAGATRATHAVVTLAADDSICVLSMVDSDVIVDVTGSYTSDPTALLFHPQPPTRIYDSRLSGGAFAANETRAIAVPAGAAAVAINVTVTEPVASGFVTVFPCQTDLPVVSNLNYVAGQIVPNAFTIGLDPSGAFNIYTPTSTHFIIDMSGYFALPPL